MKPLRLEPVYKSTIWAGDRLKRIRGLSGNIGISREVCAYKGSENRILNEEYRDMNIKELIDKQHDELLGNDEYDQLIRAAYIDSIDDLSIQVHPNDEYAKQVGDYEKTESWYILEADDNAKICAGTLTQDKEVLLKAALQGELEKYVKYIPVKEGDFAFIPAGLLHACGKNMLAIEIGSFGGITYRMYDYGRGRELQLDKGFEILDTSLSCELKHFPLPKEDINNISNAVKSKYFNVDVVDISGSQKFETNGRYCIVICVKNHCGVCCDFGKNELDYTETLLIPASIKEFEIVGKARVIIAYR